MIDMMKIMMYEDLTDEMKSVINSWWDRNDPENEVFEYADNFRYALDSDDETLEGFKHLEMLGCCGSMDVEFVLRDGSKLLYGFNYGH
jgi:hypothetical protein